MKEQTTEVVLGGLKSLPSLGAIVLLFSGWTVEKTLALFGCIFILMQMAHLAWKWRREARIGRRTRRRG